MVGTPGETTPSEYATAISTAAREYRNARLEANLDRDEFHQTQESRAYSKLCWMLDAETYGWNPERVITE